MTPQTQTSTWQDPIVQALHALREQLVEQYNGDIHAYAQACERKVQSLGIVFRRCLSGSLLRLNRVHHKTRKVPVMGCSRTGKNLVQF